MPGALAVFFDHSEILTVGLVNAALTAMAVGELCFSFKKLRMRYCRVVMPESFTNTPSFLQVYRGSPFFRWQAGIDALGELQAVRLRPDARGAGTLAPTALGLLATSPIQASTAQQVLLHIAWAGEPQQDCPTQLPESAFRQIEIAK